MTVVHRGRGWLLVGIAALAVGAAEGPATATAQAEATQGDSGSAEIAAQSLPEAEAAVAPPESGAATSATAPEAAPEAEAEAEADAESEATAKALSGASSSLADLLRLPSGGESGDFTGARSKGASVEAIPGDGPKKDPLWKVQIRSQTDPSAGYQKVRRQTDAGVSVGVGDGTRVRGGVRVEQELDQEREEPVPTVGIEKRF